MTAVDIPVWLIAILVLWSAGFWILFLGARRRTPPIPLGATYRLDADLTSIAGITRGSVCEGNAVEVLQNGDGFFPVLLRDIARARHSIHLETYIWGRGEICRQIGNALAERAREGVEVRLLVDALGSHDRDAELFERMEQAGCKVAVYCRLRPQNLKRWNHRTHRKLFVADGRIGIVFGHGISEQWTGSGQDAKHFRDTALRVVGPVVHSLQSVFTENWTEETLEVMMGDAYFPRPEAAGDVKAHVVSSHSGEAISFVGLLYSVAIASARREIIIQNPYFVPRRDVVELMARRLKEGVAIHLMLPGRRTDHALVRHAGHHLVSEMLEAGVRVYEYDRTLLHQKTMIVDGAWAHIGSTNFDARSLELSEELSIGVIDERIAAELKAAFVADLAYARELTLEQWSRRSLWHEAIDRAAYSIRDQL